MGTDTPAPVPGRRGRAPSIRRAVLQRAASSTKDGAEVDESELIFDSEEEAARLLDVTFQFLNMPALDMCEFGHVNRRAWAKDVLAITHNAIRCELEDAVTMIVALLRIGSDLTVGDIVHFRDWWRVAADVIGDFLDVESKVILPWMQTAISAVTATSDSREAPIATAAAAIVTHIPVEQTLLRALIGAVSTAFARCIGGSPRSVDASGVRQVRERLCVDLLVSFDRFITKMIRYMHNQEIHLPQVLSAHYTNEKADRDTILGLFLTEEANIGKEPDITFVLHARWMNDSKAQKAYMKKLKECYDCSFAKLQSQFEMNHGATVALLKVKAGIP